MLYNPAVPYIIDAAPELVQYIEVVPDRLWYDFGNDDSRGRFHRAHGAIETLRRCCRGRVVAGHGIGLSLPSAMPIDGPLLDQVIRTHRDLGFAWYSEHMSMFLVPHGSVPNAQAGLGLPVVYCQETLDILCDKIKRLTSELRCEILLENGAIFAPIPDMDYSEPAFFNRLHDEAGCGMLLDLHNLYVNWRNGAPHPREYLAELDPGLVQEIHIAGGDELVGFYTDSHSRLTPAPVWEWAYEFLPRCNNIRAITYEFHESYFERLGIDALTAELERMHELADTVAARADR
ncbi:MAG TPA: DUF692 family protein [Planctomycetota bacterium]|nr:DUF692 family protein [Planctomycetota bacterium]